MDFLDKAITKFCFKHPNFGIKNLMMWLVGGTGLVYIVYLMDTTGTFLNYLRFSPTLILHGQVWRLVTFLFIPTDTNIFYLLISLFLYYFIGTSLERQWGTARFTIYYATGWLFNVLYGIILTLFGFEQYCTWIDTSYLNLSLFFAYAVLWPDQQFLLMFIIPVKIKWLAWLDAALFVYEIIANASLFPFNLLPVVAILNFLIILGPTLYREVFGVRRTRKRQKIKFNKSAFNKKSTDEDPFQQKCSVCGRTSKDNPGLEFRYCSRCVGYHCFCIDHINNHIHFTE